MKRTTLIAGSVAAVLGMNFLSAQDYQRVAPKTADRPGVQKKDTKPEAPSSTPAPNEQIIVPSLKGVLIVASGKDIKPAGVAGIRGVEVRGVDFVKRAELEKALAQFLNKPVGETALKQIQVQVILVCRKADHPVVDVYYPDQDIQEGVIQMVILEGKLGQVSVVNDGHKWFSDSLIKKGVHIQPGSSIQESKLLNDVNWLNRNPFFRQVDLKYKQGKFDSETGAQTDIDLVVKDRFPFRPYVGFENNGPKVLGENRYLAGANYGNVFGLDHQFNYQYTTDTDFSSLWSHAVSYIAPLPWRHNLMIYGGYNDVKADFDRIGVGNGSIKQKGSSYQISGRYSIPLPKLTIIERKLTLENEIAAGFDFKSSDNNLEFGGINVPFARSRTDIDQFVVEYHAMERDPWGATGINVAGYISPGGLSGKNKDQYLTTARGGAEASYNYMRVDVERMLRCPTADAVVNIVDPNAFSEFPKSSYLLVKAGFQKTDSNLIPSEQLSIGGYSMVRGYSERIASGDEGWYTTVELHTPLLRVGNLTTQENVPGVVGDTLEFLGFWDFASVQQKFLQPGDEPHANLSSVGVGVRYRMSRNIDFRLDYGFQLRDAAKEIPSLPAALTESHGRAHLSVIVGY